MNKKKKIILIVIVIAVVIVVGYYIMNKTSGAGSAAAARTWLLNTFKATNQGNQMALDNAVPLMTDQEAIDTYNALLATMVTGFNGSLSTALLTPLQAVMAKYNIAGF